MLLNNLLKSTYIFEGGAKIFSIMISIVVVTQLLKTSTMYSSLNLSPMVDNLVMVLSFTYLILCILFTVFVYCCEKQIKHEKSLRVAKCMRHFINKKEEYMPQLVAYKLTGEHGKISLGVYNIHEEIIKIFKFFSYKISPYDITNQLAYLSSSNG